MTIIFYSVIKRRNSTKQPTAGGTSYTGQLTTESGVVSPTIIMDFGNTVPAYNYAYITEFNRYYWINEMTNIGGGLWRVSLSVDVLASFKTEIGSSIKYILRSASDFDGEIIDLKYPTKASKTTHAITVATDFTTFGGRYLVGVVSPNGVNGAVSYFSLSESDFETLRNNLMANTQPYYNQILDSDLKNLAISVSNPMQHIVSARYYPFDFGGHSQTATMMLGTYNAGTYGVVTGTLLTDTRAATLTAHPEAASRGTYCSYEPFTQRFLYWEPVGMIHLPSSLFVGETTLNFVIEIDIVSGVGKLDINIGTNKNIYSTHFMAGYDVPIAQSVSGNPLKIVSGAFSLFNAGLSGLAGNVAGMISSGVSAVGDFLTANVPEVQAFKSGAGSQLLPGYINILEVFYGIANDSITFFGQPLCKVRTINTLSGYMICADGEIQANTAYAVELEEIASYLTGGFFYE